MHIYFNSEDKLHSNRATPYVFCFIFNKVISSHYGFFTTGLAFDFKTTAGNSKVELELELNGRFGFFTTGLAVDFKTKAGNSKVELELELDRRFAGRQTFLAASVLTHCGI